MTRSLRLPALLVSCMAIGFACVANAQQSAEFHSLDAGSSVAESVDVLALNVRLKNEAGMDLEQARQWIETRVRTVICSESPSEPTNAIKIGIDSSDDRNIELRLDDSGHGVKVVDDLLIVVALSHEVQKVKDLIDTFTRFGVRQIEIRTHVFRDTAEAMKSLPIQWSHVEAASKNAESVTATNIRPASYEKAQPLTAAAKYIEAQKPSRLEDLPPPEGVTSATWTEATSIVERATPVLYTLLTPAEYKEVLVHAKKQSTLQRVMSPSVVVFNGQIASMSNCVERPFITGVRAMQLGQEGKQQLEFAPHVKVYHEGTTMKIRPELFDGSSVRLNCQLDLCKIRSVETLVIQGVGGRGDFNVQMPEVASTQFRTCLNMPIDYALAVSAFETDAAGIKHSVVVLCQCSMRDIEATAPVRR